MHRFDYSFLHNGMLPAALFNITSDIYTLATLSYSRKEVFADVFTNSEAAAKVQSVKSSNAIEGIATTDERIIAIVDGNSAPLSHSGQEIAEYRDAIAHIHASFRELDKRFAVIGSRKVTKQARIEATVLNSLTPISKADIKNILPHVSATTIEAVLGQLVRECRIRKVGTGRGTRYLRS